ncbi:hypothetical protein KBI23_19095 [bacterium]|nr:hypothetical protein [bacterium]MBP9807642.1 hypothetical protein [bacterium]
MTKSNLDSSSHCEARPWAEARENFAPPQQQEWGDISRQCLSDNSAWHTARGSNFGGDPTLDKGALTSGVLQFGSIDTLTGKQSKPGEAAVSVRAGDKSAPAAEVAAVGSDKGEGKIGEKGADKAADKTTEDKAATLFSRDATAEQKLATVRELANSGTTSLSYRDGSGSERKLRLEVEGAGNRQMVHLFDSGADGREKIALRGIAKADGTFEKQRDQQGNFVDYEGKGYSQLVSARPDAFRADVPSKDKSAQPMVPEGERLPQPKQAVVPEGDRQAQPRQSKDATTEPRDTSAQRYPAGSIDRSQFDSQLKDPRVMAAFAGRMHSEVGSQGPAAQLAFAEEVMNRAASRNQTLMQALTGSYYPTHNPGRSNNPRYAEAINKAWQEGTDTIHGATGNASGKVGFGVKGGHYDANRQWVSPNQTVRINGERFGYEQVDLNKGWMKKYQQLKSGGGRV